MGCAGKGDLLAGVGLVLAGGGLVVVVVVVGVVLLLDGDGWVDHLVKVGLGWVFTTIAAAVGVVG